MRKLQELFLIALFVIGVSSIAIGGPQTGGWGFGGNPRPDSYISAFFQAFPANGRGVPTACSTTAPTGYKGQVLTFTRASAGTCTKTATGGLATTGIADGDLVVLSNNVARVEYDSAGTLGLLVEAARTNSDQRSEEIDNVWWSNVATVAANPTLNGTCATSPLAAPLSLPEDYTFPATVVGQQSGRLGTTVVAFAGVAATHSYFVKGVSGSGTMDICAWNTTTPTCAPCAYTNTSWTRCTFTATSSGNVATFIGNNTLYNGGTARSSNRVCVTAAQGEVGAYATSYIPTTGATATRAAEAATFPNPLTASATPGSFSLAASGNFEGAAWSPARMVLALGSPSAANSADLFFNTDNKSYLNIWNAGPTLGGISTTAAVTFASQTRIGAQVVGGTSGSMWVNGAAVATTGTPQTIVTQPATLSIGVAVSLWADGILSRICVDPSSTRCGP